jgi:sialidase-1
LVEAAVGGVATAGIAVTSDGHLVAGATGMASPVLSATGGYADGQWHHVVFVRSATSDLATLYVDGAPVGSVAGVGTPVTGQATLAFGTAVDGTLGFVGRLDEVALYGATALDAATVATHWASR